MSIEFEKEGGIGLVTINRPEKKNAMLLAMRDDLARLCTEIDDDDEVRVVILTGAGTDFCAGADISEMAKGGVNGSLQRARAMNRAISGLGAVGKPTVAAVRGVALGMGLSMALACDVVVAGDSARMGCVQRKIGLAPDAGNAWFLSRYLGTRLAKDLIFSARMIGGEEAANLGLVNKLVKDENVMEEARAIASDLVSAPTLALTLAKRMLDVAPTMTISEFMDFEGSWLPLIAQSEDFGEGTSAFLEKRTPVFTGN